MGLYQKYRPTSLKEFFGNEDLKRDLRPFIKGTRQVPKAILFTGPSGCGKTTLARILAKSMGCLDGDIQELDTADFRGIDSIRDIRRQMSLSSLGSGSRVWILDECFAAGTLISTPDGDVPIDTIRPGDAAYSAAGQDSIVRVFKNKVPLSRVCRLTCDSGLPLLSSVDHLFFTLRGWVEARNLRRGEVLFTGDLWHGKEVPKDLCGMWQAISRCIGEGDLLRQEMPEQKEQFESQSYLQQYLQLLRQAFYDAGGSAQILLSSLLSQGTSGPESLCGVQSENSNGSRGFFQDGRGPAAAQGDESAHAGKQPKQRCQCGAEDFANEVGAWLSRPSEILSGRQWKTVTDADASSGQIAGSRCSGTCHISGSAEAAGISNKLQSGFGNPAGSACYRDRRAGTQHPDSQKQGCKEAGQVGIVRLESFEIFQPSDFGKCGWNCIGDKELAQGYVEFYDLEMAKHHSYFANGRLVHNCHKLTNDAQNALLKALENPPAHVYFILCTTDPQLLLKTVLTRCTQFVVESLSVSDLVDVLDAVCEGEQADVSTDTLKAIARSAGGSPRAAISALERVLARDPAEYDQAVEAFSAMETQVKDLCQTLMAGRAKWKEVATMIKGIREEPESVRRAVLGYMSAVLLSGQDNPRAAHVIECFKEPYFNNGTAGLVLSCYYGLMSNE